MFGSKLSSLIISTMAALKAHPEDYCEIDTTDNEINLVTESGALITLIKYEGLQSIISMTDYENMIEHLSRELNSFMIKTGYSLTVTFRKDLDTKPLFSRIEKLQKGTANRLKLDCADLVEENINVYRNTVYNEEVWIAVMTSPVVLDKVDLESIAEEHAKHIYPALKTSQGITQPLEILRAKHNAFVGKVVGTLSNKRYYSKVKVANIIDGLNFIKKQIDPSKTKNNWIPALALGKEHSERMGLKSYTTPLQWQISDNLHDMSHLFPPRISRQLMGGNAITVLGKNEGYPDNTIKCGDYVFSSIYMDTGMTQSVMFNNLFSAFNQSVSNDPERGKVSMPYSVTINITSDAMANLSFKRTLAAILAKVPPDSNKTLADSLSQVAYLAKEKIAIVSCQMSAMTWCYDDENAGKTLRERKTFLKANFETWGQFTTKENTGDVILPWASNILAMTTRHVGTKSAIPLARALEILPLTRPATPFDNGTVINKTLDGKLMTLEKFSSQMNTWVTVISGTPGSGKSVMLNNLLFETCLMPSLVRLPWITIIDKGISSTGFIDLLRDRLPEERQHLVVAKRLRKSKSHAINPFDIKVGLTRPLETERTQMISFLSTLMTEPEASLPYEGTSSFCGTVIDLVFEKIQDSGANAEPKMYKHHYSEELDKILQEYEILKYQRYEEQDEHGRTVVRLDYTDYEPVSLFSLVRKLHVYGERAGTEKDRLKLWRGRDLAHRYAMPILSDLTPIIESEEVRKIYSNRIPSGETITDYALRQIKSNIANYECFCNYTEFDVDTARVVSLDLQDVIDKRNKQQTALFFQIARMVGVKKISLSEDDVTPEKIPAIFLNYYRRMLKELNSDRKTLAFDELHNVHSDIATMRQLETDCREGRKWGLEILLASQYLTDFTCEDTSTNEKINLLGFATGVCVCSAPTDNGLTVFKDSICKEEPVLNEFDKIGISPHGLTYFYHCKTKQAKYNIFLTTQVGNRRLWSLTTDQKDRALRDAIYEICPNRTRAIAALALSFGGGASKIITERASMLSSEREVANMISDMARQALHTYDIYEQQRYSEERSQRQKIDNLLT